MKLKMKDILKQTEFYVFCIIVAFAFIIRDRFKFCVNVKN